MMQSPLGDAAYISIRAQFSQARQAGQARHREIAEAMHISEGALIAAHVGAEASALMRAKRLQPRWTVLCASLHSLGEVMALTRNIACVHEKVGRYPELNATQTEHLQATWVRGVGVDLLWDVAHWRHGFAVEESGEKGVQRSLQFYDASGTAVHKLFLRAQSDLSAYQSFVRAFCDTDQLPGLISQAALPAPATDFAAFLTHWEAIQDARDMYCLLAQVRGSGYAFLQHMPAASAREVQLSAANMVLEHAAAQGLSVWILAGNIGMTQAHRGPIDKVVLMGPWLNVLDAGFNLHVRQDLIASCWVVVVPGLAGHFSALVLFNAAGELIALIAADASSGASEHSAWVALMHRLPIVEPIRSDHHATL